MWINDEFSDNNKNYQDDLEKSPNGLGLSWDMLLKLSNSFISLVDIDLIGNKDPSKNKTYLDDRTMYEACDIVINFVDSSYWLIFAKDEDFLKRLNLKFKDTVNLDNCSIERK